MGFQALIKSKPFEVNGRIFVEVTFDGGDGNIYRKRLEDQGWATRNELTVYLNELQIASEEERIGSVGVWPIKPFLETCDVVPEQDGDFQGEITWPSEFIHRLCAVAIGEYINELIDKINDILSAHSQPVMPNKTLAQFKEDMKNIF